MDIHELINKQGFISDMDGSIYHGDSLMAGADRLIEWLERNHKKYLFVTHSSQRSPRELSQKLDRLGVQVTEKHFYTSAMAAAAFLQSQCTTGSAYVGAEIPG